MTTWDRDTERLLAAFTAQAQATVPLLALWAHGSLVMGDYRVGRSDLDLIAVLDRDSPPDEAARGRLVELHRRFVRDEPLAAGLHCSYLPRTLLDDAGLEHFTWAQGEAFARPVTPVTRRELLDAGRASHGPSPAELLPPLREGELGRFVRRDLGEFWYPATGRPHLWTQDIWVSLGMVTLARAAVTLREDRLITKREALDELGRMGAPVRALADVRSLRHDARPDHAAEPWRSERAELVRVFVRTGIERVLGAAPGGAGDPRG